MDIARVVPSCLSAVPSVLRSPGGCQLISGCRYPVGSVVEQTLARIKNEEGFRAQAVPRLATGCADNRLRDRIIGIGITPKRISSTCQATP